MDMTSFMLGRATGNGGGGSGSGDVLVVNVVSATYSLDQTWQDIFDAPYAIIVSAEEDTRANYYIDFMTIDNGKYTVKAFMIVAGAVREITFAADSADGYPVVNMGG